MLVTGEKSRIRIRIRTTKSRIHNNGKNNTNFCKMFRKSEGTMLG